MGMFSSIRQWFHRRRPEPPPAESDAILDLIFGPVEPIVFDNLENLDGTPFLGVQQLHAGTGGHYPTSITSLMNCQLSFAEKYARDDSGRLHRFIFVTDGGDVWDDDGELLNEPIPSQDFHALWCHIVDEFRANPSAFDGGDGD